MKKNIGKLNSKLTKELKNQVILITGGAGSLGSELTKTLLKYPVKSVRVLDINEHALFKLNRDVNDPRLRMLLGNILDIERIEMAGNDVDIIIHAAAIKNIEITEFNPIETIDSNINGTVNMIKMAFRNKPKKFLNISTDKAANALTLYGTTKQLGERLTSWAGVHTRETKFASVRFGNIIESRGNVFEVWANENEHNKPLSITDPNMKRYFFHVDEAVNFVLSCLTMTQKGEIFIPKMKSFAIKDLATKVSSKQKIIGLRQGEKMNEVLITDTEKNTAEDHKDRWVIRQYDPYGIFKG